MTIKSRVPFDLSDEGSMRAFHDRLDRTHLRVGQVDDPLSTATTTELAAKVAEILAHFRIK